MRVRVLVSILCVLVACVPFWWATTAIERLPLPAKEVAEWSQRKCAVSHNVNVPVQLADDVPADSKLCDAAVGHLDDLADGLCVKWSVVARNSSGVVCEAGPVDASVSYPLKLYTRPTDEVDSMAVVPHDADTHILSTTVAAHLAPFVGRPAAAVDTKTPKTASRAIQYVPRVRLVFSLMNEDAAAGGAAGGWELSSALGEYAAGTLSPLSPLTPVAQLLDTLRGVHHFELESQVQWYAPLEIDLDARMNGSSPVLDMEDLSVFVNAESWNLESYGATSGANPVRERHSEHSLHFVLYLPSTPHSPIALRDQNGAIVQNPAWLVPQWGGVVTTSRNETEGLQVLTMAELAEPLQRFSHQLARLLGVDQHMLSKDTPELRRMTVDGLFWRRTLEASGNAVETLASIVHLVGKITILGVGESVRDNVQRALDRVHALQGNGLSYKELLALAGDAQTYASRAFFDPSMLAMLYFPDEHKYAVYTPLFGPLLVPVIATLYREVRAWKLRRARPTKST